MQPKVNFTFSGQPGPSSEIRSSGSPIHTRVGNYQPSGPNYKESGYRQPTYTPNSPQPIYTSGYNQYTQQRTSAVRPGYEGAGGIVGGQRYTGARVGSGEFQTGSVGSKVGSGHFQNKTVGSGYYENRPSGNYPQGQVNQYQQGQINQYQQVQGNQYQQGSGEYYRKTEQRQKNQHDLKEHQNHQHQVKKSKNKCSWLIPAILGLLLAAVLIVALLFILGVLKWPGHNYAAPVSPAVNSTSNTNQTSGTSANATTSVSNGNIAGTTSVETTPTTTSSSTTSSSSAPISTSSSTTSSSSTPITTSSTSTNTATTSPESTYSGINNQNGGTTVADTSSNSQLRGTEGSGESGYQFQPSTSVESNANYNS